MNTPNPSPAFAADLHVEAIMSRHLRSGAVDDDSLAKAGLDSLTLVRLVIAASGPDAEGEIDLGEVAALKTVGELRRHLTGLVETVTQP